MKINNNTSNLNVQKGFTIIELMMATMVFSVIMLVAAGTVVRFTANFQKGITQSTTQASARALTDSVSQQLQFVGSSSGYRQLATPGGTTYKGQCILGTKYSYNLGQQQTESNKVLVEEPGKGEGCGGTATNLSSATSGNVLLPPNMRLAKFNINKEGDLYKVSIKVVYGDDDLLCVDGVQDGSGRDCANQMQSMTIGSNPSDLEKLQCKSTKGSQFCAVSEISTTVQNRL